MNGALKVFSTVSNSLVWGFIAFASFPWSWCSGYLLDLTVLSSQSMTSARIRNMTFRKIISLFRCFCCPTCG